MNKLPYFEVALRPGAKHRQRAPKIEDEKFLLARHMLAFCRVHPFTVLASPVGQRQHEAPIEIYRKGQIAEALRAFKKIYLEIVDDIVAHLEAQESAKSID